MTHKTFNPELWESQEQKEKFHKRLIGFIYFFVIVAYIILSATINI